MTTSTYTVTYTLDIPWLRKNGLPPVVRAIRCDVYSADEAVEIARFDYDAYLIMSVTRA